MSARPIVTLRPTVEIVPSTLNGKFYMRFRDRLGQIIMQSNRQGISFDRCNIMAARLCSRLGYRANQVEITIGS